MSILGELFAYVGFDDDDRLRLRGVRTIRAAGQRVRGQRGGVCLEALAEQRLQRRRVAGVQVRRACGQRQERRRVEPLAVGLVALVIAVTSFALILSRAQWASRIGDLAAMLANRALRVVRRGPVEWGGDSFISFRTRALGLLRVTFERLGR